MMARRRRVVLPMVVPVIVAALVVRWRDLVGDACRSYVAKRRGGSVVRDGASREQANTESGCDE
jgi:hypothetical protein